MKVISIVLSFSLTFPAFLSQDSLSLIFIGDIMGHGGQIEAAYNIKSKSYNYDPVFQKIKPIIDRADITIANLEVTQLTSIFWIPTISSPDALACKENGIDVLVTANNPQLTAEKAELQERLKCLTLCRFLIRHISEPYREEHNNLLILRKGSIRVGV